MEADGGGVKKKRQKIQDVYILSLNSEIDNVGGGAGFGWGG